jgi:transcriptional regulator with GAF, ATPase, and Fis domain
MALRAHLYEHSRNAGLILSVRTALSAAGVVCCDDEDATSIILFDSVDDFALAAVNSTSKSGRVLAVQLRDSDDTQSHWRLLQAGATDLLTWNESTSAEDIALRLQRWHEIDALLEAPLVRNNLIGKSTAWLTVLRQVIEAARYSDTPILITGESGTGKELVARLAHALDTRTNKAELVTLDCTTIVAELSGSELFGHERGAFTGALQARDGAFALARNGTLFLDEIGELPPPLQAQLLRVIQERMYKRVGGNQWQRTDFRLVCATNRNLQAEVGSGTFRGDLFYRLAGCTCELPPLRNRAQDILPLALHFFGNGVELPILTPVVREYLLRRPWPGNVRELRQLMLRIKARHVGSGPVTPGDIPNEEWPISIDATADFDDFDRAIRSLLNRGLKLKELSNQATETAIRMVVEDEGGNLQRAARRLGVTDRALQLRRANQSTMQPTMQTH